MVEKTHDNSFANIGHFVLRKLSWRGQIPFAKLSLIDILGT